MNTAGLVLNWVALHGYWFVVCGLVAAFCIRNPQERRAVVRILLVFGGIILGSIFLAAAYGKLKPVFGFPWSWASIRLSISFFAIQVESYQILSPAVANFVAHTLPFGEIFLGLWLASGIGRRASTLVASVVLLVFMIAIGYAYRHGLKIDCGCGIGPPEEAGPGALARDGLRFLLPTLIVMGGAFWLRRKSSELPAPVDVSAAAAPAPSTLAR